MTRQEESAVFEAVTAILIEHGPAPMAAARCTFPPAFIGVARRSARHRHPQPLKAFHAIVRTAREKSGIRAGMRPRE